MAQCVMTVFGIIQMHLWFADSLDSHLMVNSNDCAQMGYSENINPVQDITHWKVSTNI